MAQRRKLQVFVSSTYNDLKADRQAAVEAILTAGHIPAGMELFAAGDESQMNVIKRWISESDVYMLILGGRYGSVDPVTKKSYTQLEYEFAVEQNKPLFAVVIEDQHLEDRVKQFGSSVIETENPDKLKQFRAIVLKRMVKFWSDPRDIKLSILETLSELSLRADLVGWVPGSDAVHGGFLAEEIARLAKENSDIRQRLLHTSAANSTFNGLTFDEMYRVMTARRLSESVFGTKQFSHLSAIATLFGDAYPGILHAFWAYSDSASRAEYRPSDVLGAAVVEELISLGLMERHPDPYRSDEYRLVNEGRNFLLRLKLERGSEETNRLIL